MKTLYKNFHLLLLIVFFSSVLHAQDEDVQVVVATGMEMSQASAFSPDNRFVAQALYNSISIWDVKTGRLIRVANYVDNITQVTDTIWFSDDSKSVVVGIMLSNDRYLVDVATGKSTYVKGEAYDYSNYQYTPSVRTASTLHLYSGKKNSLVYKSPDGKAELIYKMIDNPYGNSNMMPYMYETHVKINGKDSGPLDTTFQANFTFSPDSRYAFCESDIFDLTNGRQVSKLKIVPFSGYSIMFLPDTRIAVTAGINSVRIWDFPDIEDIPAPNLVKFLPTLDGKGLIVETFNFSSGEKEYFKVDLAKRKVLGKTVRTSETGYLLHVSPDGTKYSFLEMTKKNPGSAEISYNIKVCDVETGKVVKEIKNSTKAYFLSDNTTLLIDSAGVQNFKYNLKTGSKIRFPEEKAEAGKSAYQISRDGKYLMGSTVVSSDNNEIQSEVYIWETETGKVVFTAPAPGVHISAFDMSKDGTLVSFATSTEHAVLIYDFQTATKLLTLKAHTAIVQFTYFSDDGKRLISSALDGTRRVWNLEKGTEMVNLINTGVNDFAIVTPKQYYYATKGAKKLIHFVKGDEIYPFDQFDLKYNRPDIIIESLEASNQELVRPFYYAYQKRLKRLGFTEEMLDGTFHMPTAQIDNENELPILTKDSTIILKISASDDRYKLDRLLVRVNEVPVHGKNGVSLAQQQLNSYKDEVSVELSNGKNFIQVSVLNEKGIESLGANVTVDYIPTTSSKPNLYLYTIGASKYQQSEFNLNYAAKDAQDIQLLYQLSPPPFGRIIAKEFINEQVTVQNLLTIKQELSKTEVDDAVCIFFAGHGILDVNLDYFLASYDIDFKNPAAKGIPYEVLENLLDDIPARKKLIMIDACHSGEIDKEEVALVESDSTQSTDGDISFRSINSTTLKQVGLTNSFELMKELFNDIRKSSGTVIISSAGGMEYAMEGGEWNNGVFTYCFLNGIKNKEADLNKDGQIMLSEINTFVREKVFQLTNGNQQPTNRAATLDSDWRLW